MPPHKTQNMPKQLLLSEWLKEDGSSGWPNKMMKEEEFLTLLPRPAADGKRRNKLKRQYTMHGLIRLGFAEWVAEYHRLDAEPSLTRAEFDELCQRLARKSNPRFKNFAVRGGARRLAP